MARVPRHRPSRRKRPDPRARAAGPMVAPIETTVNVAAPTVTAGRRPPAPPVPAPVVDEDTPKDVDVDLESQLEPEKPKRRAKRKARAKPKD